jgi:AraC-like DNA-binding protein
VLFRSRLIRGSSVKDAAHAAGFADELYFSRVFSRNVGMSPRNFQTANGVGRSGG